MKILYINESNQWEGATVALYRIILAMKERGHEVHVVTSNSIGPFIEKLDAIGVKHYNHQISLTVYPHTQNPVRWIKRVLHLLYRIHQEKIFISNGNLKSQEVVKRKQCSCSWPCAACS